MPAAKHSQKPPLNEAPRSRHRSKPKFDVPAEPALQEPSVGWVYRAESEKVSAVSPGNAAAPVVENMTNPFVMVGEGFFLVGLGAVALMATAVRGLIGVPIRFAGMLHSD